MSRYSISSISATALVASSGIAAHIEGADRVITGITQDSRSVSPGDIYCCIRGENFDGHEFASQAVADGAVALLVDSPLTDLPDSIAVITVQDVRDAVGHIASAAFGSPSTSLTMVGITGTNGKTTVASLLHQLFLLLLLVFF